VTDRSVLPSLTALRALEAAVRHGSFTRAAAELGVTHGAVSKHVRQLELSLGLELFARSGKVIEPTPTGRRIGAELSPLFDALARVVMDVRRGPERASLRLSVEPSLAAVWLAPRLGRFRERTPNLEIAVDSTPAMADIAAGPIDLALRFFEAPPVEPPAGCVLTHFLDLHSFPAASPEVAERLSKPASAREIAASPLIYEGGRDGWRRWFQAAGHQPRREMGGLIVNDWTLAVLAAEKGQGVLLIDAALCVDALRAGRLTPLSPLSISAGGYWFVTPATRPTRAPGRDFMDWALAELRASADHLPPLGVRPQDTPGQDRGQPGRHQA